MQTTPKRLRKCAKMSESLLHRIALRRIPKVSISLFGRALIRCPFRGTTRKHILVPERRLLPNPSSTLRAREAKVRRRILSKLQQLLTLAPRVVIIVVLFDAVRVHGQRLQRRATDCKIWKYTVADAALLRVAGT